MTNQPLHPRSTPVTPHREDDRRTRHDLNEATTHTPVTPRVSRGDETKAAFKTTEFIAYVLAVVGVLAASFLVKTTDAHEDYFRADRAWLYVVVLTVGYLLSRGLAKSGSRHHDGP